MIAADSNNSVSPSNAVNVTVNVSFGAALTSNVKSYWSAPGVTSITTSTTTSLFDTRRTIARKRFTRLNASSSAPACARLWAAAPFGPVRLNTGANSNTGPGAATSISGGVAGPSTQLVSAKSPVTASVTTRFVTTRRTDEVSTDVWLGIRGTPERWTTEKPASWRGRVDRSRQHERPILPICPDWPLRCKQSVQSRGAQLPPVARV